MVFPRIPSVESEGVTGVNTQERAMSSNPAAMGFVVGSFNDLPIKEDAAAVSFQGCNDPYFNLRFYAALTMERVVVSSSSLNGLEKMSFNSLPNLVSIDIGDECCKRAWRFHIASCNRLTSVKIGCHCFDVEEYNSKGSKELQINSCKALRSLTIGDNSFTGYRTIIFSGSLSASW